MNQQGLNLLRERYCIKGESTWKDVANRVGGLYSRARKLIKEMRFVPGSPILMNGNTNGARKGTLSSCFPMDIEDSIEGIYESLKEAAIVTKAGGGVGYDFSALRGDNEIIESLKRKSSGPLGFIDNYNGMLSTIQQGGVRRGAGMAQLIVNHPVILDFIGAKEDYRNEAYNRFNFSVRMPDWFYEKLDNSPDEVLRVKNVVDGDEHEIKDHKGTTVTVQHLWDKMIYHAWSCGEPGIFNSDIAYDQCTVTNVSKTVLSNPCLSGDTLIAVADGRGSVSIKQLAEEGKDIPVYTLNHQGELEVRPMLNPRKTRDNAKIFEVTFDSGMTVKCTDNHKFLTTDGNMVELKDLDVGSSIKSVNKHVCRIDEAYPYMKKTRGQDYSYWENNGVRTPEHWLVSEYTLGRKMRKGEIVHHKDYHGLNNSPNNLEVMIRGDHNKLHAQDMLGNKNPVFRIKDKETWRKRISEANTGLNNSSSYDISNEEIIEKIKDYCKHTYGGFFTKDMWKELGFPILLSDEGGTKQRYRFGGIPEYCEKAGIPYIMSDYYHRLIDRHESLKTGGFNFEPTSDYRDFDITKSCETCSEEFVVDYEHRHVTFCSDSCLHKHIDKPYMLDGFKFSDKYLARPDVQRRVENTLEVFEMFRSNSHTNFKKECPLANTYIRPNNPFAPSLKFVKENVDQVKTVADLVSIAESKLHEIKAKKEVASAVDGYNHKIVSVKHVGEEAVYDGTVEDTHTIIIGGKKFINDWNKKSEEFVVTGQCSEFVSVPYSSCNLGSLNLLLFVRSGKFDWDRLEKAVEIATIFLDRVIDKNDYPLKKIAKVTKKIRPIGLGVMGVAHMFYALGVPYNSEEARTMFGEIMYYITMKSTAVSIDLAKKKGHYPGFDLKTYMKANRRFFPEGLSKFRNLNLDRMKEDIKEYGVRNHSQTSIAPTGSISFLANVSSCIEPVFSLAFIRKIEKLDGEFEEVYVTDPIFEKYLSKHYRHKKKKILKEVSDNNGSCQKSKILKDEEKAIFVTAKDLTAMEHLEFLAVACHNTSLSVAKTVNLPKTATREDIAQVYREAHKRGVIGVTVYREGSRQGILVSGSGKAIKKTHAPKRPEKLLAKVTHHVISRQRYYAVVGLYKNEPYEVFTGLNYDVEGNVYIPKDVSTGLTKKVKRGKYELTLFDEDSTFSLTGKHNDDNADALTRQISTGLRHGVDISFVVHQLEKTQGPITCFAKVIARALKEYIEDGTSIYGDSCPACKNEYLIRKGGCPHCDRCGWHQCG